MCFKRSDDDKYQFKCTVIGVSGLIIHTILVCYAIAVVIILVNRNTDSNDLKNGTKIYFGKYDKNQFFGLYGTLIALGVIGAISSVTLIIGSKYKKPGYIVVFICYSLTLTILLLISGILVILSLQWKLALATFGLSGITCNVTMEVNKYYDAMVQDEMLICQNSTSDFTLLIEDDLPNDDASIPAV